MRPWNTMQSIGCGGAIGLAAAAIKLFGPWSEPQSGPAIAEELIGAALGFALLCGVAVALRNFIRRRLLGPEI